MSTNKAKSKSSTFLNSQTNHSLSLSQHTHTLARPWLYTVLVRPSLAPLSYQRPEKEGLQNSGVEKRNVCVCVCDDTFPQRSQPPSFACRLSLISLALLSFQPSFSFSFLFFTFFLTPSSYYLFAGFLTPCFSVSPTIILKVVNRT